jgi:Rrf2 family protein
MQLTRAGDYAVRVMIHLASAPWGAVVRRGQIQEREGVPPAHLAKIIQALGRAKLVRTFRGSGGGVSLAVRPEEVNLRQVIEAVEGPIHLNRCLVRPGACPRDVFCTAHPVWQRIQEALMRELDAVTVASLTVPGGLAGPAGPQGKGQGTLP